MKIFVIYFFIIRNKVIVTLKNKLFADCGSDENAIATVCGPSCVFTCQKPRPPGMACLDVCVTGCFCKRDFTLDEESNKCVKYVDCPKTL